MTYINFQSLEDVEIHFKERGVHRFAGLNNTGKSAALKGISTVMQNVSNRNYKEYIRDDEDTFEIIWEDFNNNRVHLSRGAVDFYEWSINGKKGRVDKTNGRVPKEIKEYFNLYIEDEKTNECLNIRLPREALLFVDTSAGDNAMMFQKALGTEEYMIAIKQVDRTARESEKNAKLIEKYREQEQMKLDDSNSELFTAEQSLSELERFEGILQQEYEEYKGINHIVTLTEEHVQTRKDIARKKEILDELNIEPIQTGIQKLNKVTGLVEVMQEAVEITNRNKVRQEKIEEMELDTLEADLQKYSQIEQLVNAMEVVEKTTGVLTGKKEKVSNIDNTNLDKEFTKLQMIKDMVESATNYAVVNKKNKDKKQKLETLTAEFEEFRKELGFCPLCNANIEHAHAN